MGRENAQELCSMHAPLANGASQEIRTCLHGGNPDPGGSVSQAIESRSSELDVEVQFIFKWRTLAAYWASTSSLIGSMLFTFGAGVGAFHPSSWPSEKVHLMSAWPMFIAELAYIVSAVFTYLQLINVPTNDANHMVFVCRNWRGILDKGVRMESCIGSVSYLLGAIVYQIGCTTALWPDSEVGPEVLLFLSILPNLLGSFGFVTCGVCEFLMNCVGPGRASVWEPAWWAASTDLLGSLCFLGGSLPPGWMPFETFPFVAYFIGCCNFTVSSVAMLMMWEANDVGLTLLRQLSQAIVGNYGSNENTMVRVMKRGFTLRGMLLLCLCSLFVCEAIIACIMAFMKSPVSCLQHFPCLAQVSVQLLLIAALALILVVLSVVTRVPKLQPHRCVFQSLRILLLFGSVLESAFVLLDVL